MIKSDIQERPRTDSVTEAQWIATEVKRLRAQADRIEAKLPATDRELELLECLTKRRADGRLLRVRKIARLLGRTSNEIHDSLASLERKGLVARPSMESGTYRLEVLESGPSR